MSPVLTAVPYVDRAAFEVDHVGSPHFGFYTELASRVLVDDGHLAKGDVVVDGSATA